MRVSVGSSITHAHAHAHAHAHTHTHTFLERISNRKRKRHLNAWINW